MSKPTLRRLDPGYLKGWFLVEVKGDGRLATKLAAKYLAAARRRKTKEQQQ